MTNDTTKKTQDSVSTLEDMFDCCIQNAPARAQADKAFLESVSQSSGADWLEAIAKRPYAARKFPVKQPTVAK